MKKILILIFLILLAFLSYTFFIPEKKDEIKKIKEKPIKQETVNIDYQNIKIEKELVETLPSNTQYEEKKYKDVKKYTKEKYIKKEEFSINPSLDVDKDKQEVKSVNIEIFKKF